MIGREVECMDSRFRIEHVGGWSRQQQWMGKISIDTLIHLFVGASNSNVLKWRTCIKIFLLMKILDYYQNKL